MQAFVSLLVTGLAGCAPELVGPLTPADLAERDTAEALVQYLSQPGASAAVCGRDPAGLRISLAALDRSGAATLVRGLYAGRVAPERFRDCLRLLLERSGEWQGQMLAGVLLEALVPGVSGSRRAAPSRFAAVATAYRERPAHLVTDPARRQRVAQRLGAAIPGLRSEARHQAQATLEALGVEAGRWRGQIVTRSSLDALLRQRDLAALELLARRLPGADARREAARRAIRLAIDASRFPELRARAAEVEENVLEQGRNVVSLERFPPVHGVLVGRAAGATPVALVQDVVNQQVAVQPPSLPLRGVLWLTLAGVSHPVTLCPEPRSLDPTPCVAPAALKAWDPRHHLGPDGVLRLGRYPMREAIAHFGSPDRRFAVPLLAGGRVVATLERPLRWVAPPPLWFLGPRPGGPGPPLWIDLALGPRLRLEVISVVGSFQAVVEAADLGRLLVVTRGGRGRRGAAGSAGAAGSDGSDGSSGSCPSSSGGSGTSGGSGGDGGPGGPGGPGGRGGDILVRLRCAGERCADFGERVAAAFVSLGGEGGEGGPGGPGGPGGRGGRGGSGASCTDADGNSTSVSGGSDGSSGSSGSSGPDGPAGPPGAPGVVTVHRERRP